MSEHLIQSRRNRQTSTIIEVISADDSWATICADHGTVCSFDTQAHALSFAASPIDWCEDCCESYQETHR